jgi:hypothetical protein
MISSTSSEEWIIEDCSMDLQNGESFYHCDIIAEFVVESFGFSQASQSITGEIKFPHSVPVSTFFEEDGCPNSVGIRAENNSKNLLLEDVLVTTSPAGNSVEFIARDGEFTISNDEESDDDRVRELLTELHEEIK